MTPCRTVQTRVFINVAVSECVCACMYVCIVYVCMYVYMNVRTAQCAAVYFRDHLFCDQNVDWIQLWCFPEQLSGFVKCEGH